MKRGYIPEVYYGKTPAEIEYRLLGGSRYLEEPEEEPRAYYARSTELEKNYQGDISNVVTGLRRYTNSYKIRDREILLAHPSSFTIARELPSCSFAPCRFKSRGKSVREVRSSNMIL